MKDNFVETIEVKKEKPKKMHQNEQSQNRRIKIKSE